ncbi:carbohydrate porin [Phormidium tenue FACHB-886]|nr:carbohydrate porin [Phormidium tenue FACHB-886]
MLSKVFWRSLLTAPALLGTALVVSSTATAAETQLTLNADDSLNKVTIASSTQISDITQSSTLLISTEMSAESIDAAIGDAVSTGVELQATTEVAQVPAPVEESAASTGITPLNQLAQYSSEGTNIVQEQVTSISQLTDVQPTDWAFQALQSLVERYGCIVGYPDSTYRGNQALTRYEFAAGLNACLDRISELIASSTADLATKEDLATLQRLQEEFAAELATLRGRVDSLEARTAELEANQFSTTTKLRGETIFVVGVPLDSDEDAFGDEQVIAGYRVRLNFDTSFTGDDLLRARLQARDLDNFNAFGGSNVNTTEWNISSDAPGNGATNDVTIDDLYYRFSVGRAQITLGANSFSDTDLPTSAITPFESGANGSLINFGEPPQYNFLRGDAGVGLSFSFTGEDSPSSLSLDLAYTAGEPDNPSAGNGLFNGDYSALVQLTYLSDFIDAALTYGNSYRDSSFLSLSGPGDPEVANVYAGQVNFKFGAIEIGGGVAYVPIRRIGVGDYDAWSYQATVAFRDLGGEGNLLGILAGVTPYGSAIPEELSGPINEENNFLVEGFYRFNVNDNISVTPSLIYLSAPGNDEENDGTLVGAIRTTFRF